MVGDRIGGIMVSMLTSSAVDRGFELRSGQTKDCKIGICYFSAKQATLVNFQWDEDDEVRFALDQHAELDIYSASSLKQQSAGRHVTPPGHIINDVSLRPRDQPQM
jgi:hypothetical protein